MTPAVPSRAAGARSGALTAIVLGALTLYAGYTLLAVLEDANRPSVAIEAFTDRTVDLSLSAGRQDADWPLPGDRLTRVNGEPLADGRAFDRALAQAEPGAAVTITFERAEAGGGVSVHHATARPRPRPFVDWLAVGLLYWVSGVTVWMLGALVAFSGPKNVQARQMVAWSFINGLGVITASVHHPGFPFLDQGVRLGIEAVIGAVSLVFFTGFPRAAAPWLARASAALAVGLGLAFAAFCAQALTRPVVGPLPNMLGLLWAGGVPFAALTASLLWTRLSPASTAQERAQGRIVLVGALGSLGPAAFAGFLPHAGVTPPGLYLVCPLSWVMPASLAIAVIRHRLFAIDAFLRPTLAYALTAVALVGAYLGLVELGRAWLGVTGLVEAIATAVIALAFAPLRDGVVAALDRAFFRAPYDPVAARDAFEARAEAAPDAAALSAAWAEAIATTLAPAAQRLALVGQPPLAVGDRPGRWAIELAVGPAEAPFGHVALARAKSGRRYSPRDRAFVETLAGRLAWWAGRLENAEAERRRADAQARAVAMQEQLLSIVSHELRTPISAIIQATALVEPGLSGEPEEPDWEAYRSRVARQSKTLSLLVDDLLQAGQLQAGALMLRPRSLDLAETVDEAVSDMEALADARQVSLECEDVSDFPLVTADPNRLLQVLRNLLHNAIKHSPTGGVVAVSWAREGAFVRVAVRDDGPGVAPEARDDLFNRFGGGTGRGDGIGLGLHIVKSIVESQGGDAAGDRPLVGVESAPGEGATFWFLVPLADGPA